MSNPTYLIPGHGNYKIFDELICQAERASVLQTSN
jgi:hypothetical protein